MADVITRFKLETTQYDSKLRDAAKSLKDFSHVASMSGKDFDRFTQKNIEVARSFGNIATSATNSKDKVKELVGAYNDVAKAYNALTKEQQQSDFGKAMAQSLQTLQGRIREAKAEMNDTGGILGQLKDKFVINIDAMKVFNAGLAAAKGALEVAKDAFFASEQNVDEWAGVVAASESVYEGFLTAINNGDISGYLGRIDQIVKAAREAYNELDRLGTMKTIQAPAMSKQEAENNRMRMMIMTGRYIAPADGRKASMANGTLLSPEQIRSIEQKLQNGMKTITSLTKNELDQTGKAIDAYYKKLAVQNGMSLSEFRNGTSSMAEFDKRVAGAKKYDEWQMAHSYVDQSTGRLIAPRTGNPYAQYAGWNNFRVDKQGQNSYNDLVNLIKQQQQQQSQLYSQMGQTYRTVNRAEGITVRGLLGGSGGGGGNNGPTYAHDSIAAMEAEVSNLTKLWKEAGAAVRDDYAAQLEEAKLRLDTVTGKNSSIAFSPEMAARQLEVAQGKNVVKIPMSSDVAFDEWLKEVNAKLEETKIKPIQIPIEAATDNVKKLQDTARTTAKVVGTIGQAFNAIEDPAGKVAAVVAQAIANVALAYSDALAKTTAEKFNIWSFIAASASAMISMGTTIASIHQATGYAQGGMIKGNSYSGDNVGGLVDGSQLVGLNAGELVLTKAQQSNLAQSLQNNGQTIRVVGKLHGKDLFICAENWSKSAGHGEFVTW